ncbi:MAG: hypothetical protein Q9171_006370 [Xanthocarpia ochracea]
MDHHSKEIAAEDRIITHMNANHQDSLIRYLRHTHRLSSFRARNAHLTSVSYSSLTISTSPTSTPNPHTYLIPFDPPMTSYTEARTRLASLDAAATSALNVSPLTLKKYIRPRGFQAAIFILVIIFFLLFPRRANFLPGAYVYDLVSSNWRYGESVMWFCFIIQPVYITLVLSIHIVEMIYMERSRLRKYNVPRFGGLWWAWIASTFVEGWGAFVRVDKLMREKEKKAKAEH